MSGDTFEFDDKARVERLVGTLHDPQAAAGDVLTIQPDGSVAAAPGGGGAEFYSAVAGDVTIAPPGTFTVDSNGAEIETDAGGSINILAAPNASVSIRAGGNSSQVSIFNTVSKNQLILRDDATILRCQSDAGVMSLLILNLPTADPHVVGAIWNSAGTLNVSAG